MMIGAGGGSSLAVTSAHVAQARAPQGRSLRRYCSRTVRTTPPRLLRRTATRSSLDAGATNADMAGVPGTSGCGKRDGTCKDRQAGGAHEQTEGLGHRKTTKLGGYGTENGRACRALAA